MAKSVSKNALVAVNSTLERMTPQFAQLLPEHVSVDRFKRTAMNAVTMNPDLLTLNQKSLFLAIREAAGAGLELGGFTGEGYIVPMKGNATFIPGYRGLLKLVRQSGMVSSIECEVIRQGDEVTWIGGDQGKFEVIFDWQSSGEVLAAYAIARFTDGSFQRVVMPVRDINKIRDGGPSKGGGPWKAHYEEMAKKTVLRRLCKLLPMSRELTVAVSRDEAVNETGKMALAPPGAFIFDADGSPLDEGVGEQAEEKPARQSRGKNAKAKEEGEELPDIPESLRRAAGASEAEVIPPGETAPKMRKTRTEQLVEDAVDESEPDASDPDDDGLFDDDDDDNDNDAI